MQQIFNAGSVAGPALAAWLVTRTGGWQSTWWMTCTIRQPAPREPLRSSADPVITGSRR